jgi:hypothetical protein
MTRTLVLLLSLTLSSALGAATAAVPRSDHISASCLSGSCGQVAGYVCGVVNEETGDTTWHSNYRGSAEE